MNRPAGLGTTRSIRGPGLTLTAGRRPLIMGILNVTPDSFSDGGMYFHKDVAIRRAMEMADEGADIIDVGGESTRPGATRIGPDEEMSRVLPVIQALAGRISAPISIDTRRAIVARAALEAGCWMVNDVSACRDPDMPGLVREFGAPIVLMHMKGDPESMQINPHYDDVVSEVGSFLADRVEFVKQHGVEDDMIVVDPGIGFGKRFRDNLDLLRSIAVIKSSGRPVMVGASRKRFLGELLSAGPWERSTGSLAVAAWCFENRVEVVRVHEVKETAGLFRVLDAIENPDEYPAAW